MSKTIIILEQTSSNASTPDSMDFDRPRGYQVKEVKEVKCDHPDSFTRFDKENGKLTETCNVCGEKSSLDIDTPLLDNNDN